MFCNCLFRLSLVLLTFHLCFGSYINGEEFYGPTNLNLGSYDTLIINGPAQLRLVKAKSLNVKGPLKFNHLDISGDAKVLGPVNGEKGKFGSLTIDGTLEVDHLVSKELHVKGFVKSTYLKVDGSTDIIGKLDVKHGEFQDLAITSETITLEDVTVNNIVVRKNNKSQTLVLKGSTVVNGDITFESGNGVIQKDPTVQIKGTVKGN